MKKETIQKLNDVLDIADDVIETVEESPKPDIEITPLELDDKEADYNFSRGQYHNLIEKGNEALIDLLSIAREGEQPRAFEVATQLINSLTAATKELLVLQKTKKEIESQDKTGTKTENNLFIGSTKELQELLEQKKK